MSLSSLASSIGKKSSLTVSHFSLSFCHNKRTTHYADAAVFIFVQTGQNLHESISTFYKLHPHPQKCFSTSHAKCILTRFGFHSKSFFSLQISKMCFFLIFIHYLWHLDLGSHIIEHFRIIAVTKLNIITKQYFLSFLFFSPPESGLSKYKSKKLLLSFCFVGKIELSLLVICPSSC